MLVKMLIRTRKRVTNNVIRPGITSGGIRKLALKNAKHLRQKFTSSDPKKVH
jgi:hypothetical protein